MPAPRPSRQALEHLSRLCRNLESNAQAVQPTPLLPSCLHLRSQNLRSSSKIRHDIPRKSVLIRTITTTRNLRVQPNTTQDPDPQNRATPIVLPDITNYYTLFPSTLPAGPPGPSTPTQDPETTTTTTDQSPPPSSPSTAPFSIPLPTLRKEFLKLQSTHHPDKFPTGSTAHQKALALSSLINNAYKTLADPLLRAQYLLQLRYDVDVTSEDNAAHPTDQQTLMEVMEAQERVEEASDQQEVDALKDENRTRIVETERSMGRAFEDGDVQRAKEECVRLKYWRSLQGALDDWEEGKEVRLIH